MPRTVIPIQTCTRTLLLIGAVGSETAGDATNDHYFSNDGKTILMVRNSGVTTRTVEVVIQATVDGVTPAVKTYSLLTGSNWIIGPFPVPNYSPTDGQVQVNVDHAEVKLMAVSLSGL